MAKERPIRGRELDLDAYEAGYIDGYITALNRMKQAGADPEKIAAVMDAMENCISGKE